MTDLYIAALRQDLRMEAGFQCEGWERAARYAIGQKRASEAVEFATNATGLRFIGEENFRTLSTLADAQELAGKTADAAVSREKALNHPTASVGDLHTYARQLQNAGKKEEALRVFELNAKKHPNAWPVNAGLARGYSAVGRYKDALKYAKLALAQAPDDQNKKFLQDAITKLEAGKDMNV
jgi:tetratricopeptide (TPR) repeat protein